MGLLAMNFNFGIGWPNNSSAQLHKTVKIDLESLFMLNMFIHFLIILSFFHFKVHAMANYTSHAAVDPNFENGTSIKPKKNMQIFKISRNIFFYRIFAPFFLVSMRPCGPEHFSDILFFVLGGPIKNLHKKTAKIDQK